MIRIDAIATRTGDTGTTGLSDGTRVGKDHPLIEVLGAVDEANSVLGLVRGQPLPEDVAAALGVVQNDCFDLGGDLATPPGGPYEDRIPRITTAQVVRLDGWLADNAARLPPLRSFVLPGGSLGAQWFHVARTVVRRAERALVAAQHRDPDRAWNPECLRYLNRLSDLCFAWARRCNEDGRSDVQWVPGAHRE